MEVDDDRIIWVPPNRGDFLVSFWDNFNQQSNILFEWFSMVDSMGSRLSSEGIMYYISKLSNEGEFPIKFIPTALVNQLFEFYGRELIEIQRTVFGSNEDQWYKLPDYLLTHIREYCETCLSESKSEL